MPEFVSIISAGPHCSLQDGGRVGHQAFGVPEGGAMDRDALILGNRLVLAIRLMQLVLRYALAGLASRPQSR